MLKMIQGDRNVQYVFFNNFHPVPYQDQIKKQNQKFRLKWYAKKDSIYNQKHRIITL